MVEEPVKRGEGLEHVPLQVRDDALGEVFERRLGYAPEPPKVWHPGQRGSSARAGSQGWCAGRETPAGLPLGPPSTFFNW